MKLLSFCLRFLLLALVASGARADDGVDELGAQQRMTFDEDSASTDLAHACAAQSDGKVLLAGSVSAVESPPATNETIKIGVARLGLNSLPDATFGLNGDGRVVIALTDAPLSVQATHGQVRAMAVDPQGRILLAGSMVTIGSAGFPSQSIGFVLRLLEDGWIDPVFGINGIYLDFTMNTGAVAVGVDPAHRIWALGRDTADGTGSWVFTLLDSVGNFHSNGSVGFTDLGFATTVPTAMAFQPDGKVLLGGWARTAAPDPHASMAVARVEAPSLHLLDPAFGTAGRLVITDFASAYLRSIALQPDGQIVVAGEYGVLNEEDIAVHRRDANGQLGSGAWTDYVFFNFENGLADGSSGNNRMVVQSDGKIVVAALAATGDAGNVSDIGVARLLADSGADPSFGGAGTGKRHTGLPPLRSEDGANALSCLTLAGGKAVIVGSGHLAGSDWDFAHGRLGSSLVFADSLEIGSTFFWSPQ